MKNSSVVMASASTLTTVMKGIESSMVFLAGLFLFIKPDGQNALVGLALMAAGASGMGITFDIARIASRLGQ